MVSSESLLATPYLDSKSLMSGKHYIMGTIRLLPYINYYNVSADRRLNGVNGFIYEIVDYIATKYQFSYDYTTPVNSVYGSPDKNGNWSGLIGMLIRKELDMIAGGFVITYPRFQVADFSVQFYNDPVTMLIPYPSLDDAINGIIRPFQYDVWAYIIISLFGTTFFLWMIYSLELWVFDKGKKSQRFTLYKSFWSLLDFDFVDMDVTNSSRLPIRILATVWCLVSFVLVNAYSSTLTAYIMTPRYHPIVDSIDDVIALSRPFFMVTKDTSYETTILNAKEGSLLKLGDNLRKYPELRITTRNQSFEWIVDTIVREKKSLTVSRSVMLNYMEKDMQQTGKCRLYIAKESWDVARMALMLQKNSPLTPFFNRQINWLRDVGLLDYWQRRNWIKENRCSAPLPTDVASETRLTMDSLSSSFILLGCGIVGSSIVFLVEWAIRIFKSNKI